MKPYKILFFGDIVGAIGRKAVITALPDIRKEHAPDLVIANVENLAHGRGITAKTLEELDAAGVDGYTGGNHTWENPLGLPCFDDPRWKSRMTRPANVKNKREGVGQMTLTTKDGMSVTVINLLGTLFMKDEVESPFLAFDRIYADLDPAMPLIVDLHAETCSEKEAFGHYVDGRATAVFGTHTHVPTADQKVLPGGTAYVTDVGRNGGYDTVVGFQKQEAVQRFLNPKARAYDPPESGTAEVNAVLLTTALDSKRAVALTRIRKLLEI